MEIAMRRRGTRNALLCRFMTWFWFNRENRMTRWPTTVVEVLGPSTFRVDKGGSRITTWLRGEGCIGYEYPRQTWIAIGEFLRRYKWFMRFNRPRCPFCDHDQFKDGYRDYIEGTLCESELRCKKCNKGVYWFAYGHQDDYMTSRWLQYEEKIFGALPKS
jgi:hypothetical protein